MKKVYILTVILDTDGHFSFGLEHPSVKVGFNGWGIQCGWVEESVARKQAVKILDNMWNPISFTDLGKIYATQIKHLLRRACLDIIREGSTDRYECGAWDGSITFGEVF